MGDTGGEMKYCSDVENIGCLGDHLVTCEQTFGCVDENIVCGEEISLQ